MPKIKLKLVIDLELKEKDGKYVEDKRFPQEIEKTVLWDAIPRKWEWVWVNLDGEDFELQVREVFHIVDKGEVEIWLDPQWREILTSLLRQKNGWKGVKAKRQKKK